MFGIGVITYKRPAALARTLSCIKTHTKTAHYLVIADDGSEDDTVELCHRHNFTVITGSNRGVCWNKNRALHTLIQHNADPIILLEDDCYPESAGWDVDWIKSTQRYSHVNYAHPAWPNDWCRGGSGTSEDPWVSWEITGQATITTREALLRVGYLNPVFVGYGYGHIEWTERFCKAQYMPRNAVPCIRCGLALESDETFKNVADVHRNYWLAARLRQVPFSYCPPWCCEEEKTVLETEIQQGLARMPLKPVGDT